MIICPNCHVDLSQNGCPKCNWQLQIVDGVSQCLSEKDARKPLFNDYLNNYEQIANDDLSVNILPLKYIDYQAKKLLNKIPFNSYSVVCDVGSGQGFMLNSFKNAGVQNIFAVDIAMPYLRQHAKNNSYQCYFANAENLPFREHFDVIVATDVLEHVLNCGESLLSMHRALKTGGILAIRVPYRENIMQYTSQYNCPYDFVHLRTFNKQTLNDLLDYASFSVEKIWCDGFWLNRPRKFIGYNRITNGIFNRLARLLIKDNDPVTINRLNNSFCSFFMTPLEICVIARKVG